MKRPPPPQVALGSSLGLSAVSLPCCGSSVAWKVHFTVESVLYTHFLLNSKLKRMANAFEMQDVFGRVSAVTPDLEQANGQKSWVDGFSFF